MNKYDVIIIGSGPGGIFSAYELINLYLTASSQKERKRATAQALAPSASLAHRAATIWKTASPF